MNLVERIAKESEKKLAQLKAEEAEKGIQKTDAPTEPAEDNTPVAPQDAPGTPTPDGDALPEPEQTPASEPEPSAEPQPDVDYKAQVDALIVENEKLQHRLSVLVGKYNKDGFTSLERENTSLQEQIATLKKQLDEASSRSLAQPENVQPDPADVEEFGQETAQRLAERRAADMKAMLAVVDKRMEQAQAEERESKVSIAKTRYFEQLDKAWPGWENHQEDPQYVAFLQTRLVGNKTYGSLLHEAHGALDAETVVGIFDRFTKRNGAKAQDAPKKGAEMLTAPGKPRASTTLDENQKPIYTKSEIEQFFKDRGKGRIKPTKENLEREKAYNLAIAERRVSGVF